MSRPRANVEVSGSVVPRWLIGLDVGGTKTEGVLLRDGEVEAVVRTATAPGPEGVLRTCRDVVDRLRPDARGPAGPGGGVRVGVGVPGVVDRVRGTVTAAVNLGIEAPFPLGPRLAALAGAPVVVENDLDVAALGAGHLLAPGGDFAYLSLGTGLAAGLVLGGSLRRGAGGVVGEVGHLVHRPDGPPCACGQRGCLELYASGRALERQWVPSGPEPAPVDLFRRAAAGEPRALAVRDAFADAVATAVSTLVLVVGVRQVVLGGGVSALGPQLVDVVGAALERRADGSAFLRDLEMHRRILLAPRGLAVAPVGAALAAQTPEPAVDALGTRSESGHESGKGGADGRHDPRSSG